MNEKNTMIKKYLASLKSAAKQYNPDRKNTAFINAALRIANNKYKINAASTTSEQDAWFSALDIYFKS